MPELKKTLIKRSRELYPFMGGRYNETDHFWRFPGGELIEFGHIEHEQDIGKYHGLEAQYLGFDELTLFTENQYLYLCARLRSSRGVPCRIRAGTNPGSDGHEWVFKRWGAWLDPEAKVRAKDGEVLYFLREKDTFERVVEKGTRLANGRCFISAKLEDNPKLFEDGQYEAGLQDLDPVRWAQLRGGNWLIKPGKGLYFKRDWFTFIDRDQVPVDAVWCRYWDRAATEPEPGKDPDWTVGLLLARTADGKIFVVDIARTRGNPGDIEAYILATAEADGVETPIWLEQEPGASGKSEIASYIRLLSRFNVHPDRKRTDKVVAAGPVSAQASAKNISIVRAPWNTPFIAELEQFPEGSHDDQVDALSGAYAKVHRKPRPKDSGAVGAAVPFEERTVGSD